MKVQNGNKDVALLFLWPQY